VLSQGNCRGIHQFQIRKLTFNVRIADQPASIRLKEHRGTEFNNPQLDERATTRYVITRGVVRMQDPTILILSSLADGDKHGYAIMEDILVFAGIRLGPGTLYGAICRLEERGWIRAVKSESRRQPYRITSEGSQHLKEQLALLQQVVRTGNRRLREV
jgi:DNA-binding PadR family transcriptional regulator